MMNNKSKSWKTIAFFAACIGCCAVPLLIGLLGGSVGLFSASFFAESKELILLTGTLMLVIVITLMVKRYNAKSKNACCISCACKRHTVNN